MNALAQIIQRREVFTPLAINGLQQHHALKLGEVLFSDGLHLAVENSFGRCQHARHNIVHLHRFGVRHPTRHRHIHRPFVAQMAL